MKRYRVRQVEFIGTEEFTQGYGMTYDDVVIELADGEEVFHMQATWKRGRGFDAEIPCIRAFIATPIDP